MQPNEGDGEDALMFGLELVNEQLTSLGVSSIVRERRPVASKEARKNP
jgi:hypothetical protein